MAASVPLSVSVATPTGATMGEGVAEYTFLMGHRGNSKHGTSTTADKTRSPMASPKLIPRVRAAVAPGQHEISK